jgi:hypothetical protein
MKEKELKQIEEEDEQIANAFTFTVYSILLYILFVIINSDPNPRHWSVFDRIVFLVGLLYNLFKFQKRLK